MGLLSMTDCSVEENLVQAKHELSRSEISGSSDAFTAWAMKWGFPLIEGAQESIDKGDEEDGPLAKAYQEATDAEAERDDLQSAVDVAITKLERLLDDGIIDEKHEAYAEIDGLIATLQDA